MSASPDPVRSLPAARHVRIVVAVIMTVQAALLVYTSRANFVTADEPGYFAAAITAWKYGELDLYRVNPPLARMAAVVPLLPRDIAEDTTRWHPELAGARSGRQVGEDFAAANGASYLGMIRVARLFTIACALLGSWIVFAWTRELFGPRAGVLALVLWCLEPNVLAHASLMTPDVPATVLGLAATWRFWRLLDRVSWRGVAIAGVLLGLAVLAKFTNLYLLGAWPVLALIARRRSGAATADRISARQLAAIAGIALVVINVGYGFKGTLTPLGSFEFTSDVLAGTPEVAATLPAHAGEVQVLPTGNRFKGSWLASIPVPVPADFVRGLDVQRRDFEHRFQSYLDGEWRDHGWWYYYVYALALKVPLGTLALALAGIVLAIRGVTARPRDRSTLATLCVLVPAACVLVLVSSQTGFNAHLRYVLPMFPFVAICAGQVATRHDRGTSIAIAVAVAASAISTLRVLPDPLTYFNELAGGPSRGDAHLLDSNLDWGQGALALDAWLERHAPGIPLQLAYFGGADPRILGLRYTLPPRDEPGLRFAAAERMTAIGPHPGLFAVSVNFVRGLSFDAPDGSGGWRPIGARDYVYFQRFEPIATTGAIRLYCVTPAEANTARAELGLPPLELAAPVDCAGLAR